MEKFKFFNLGQVLIGIIFVVVTVSLIMGGLYYYLQKQMPEIAEIIEKPAEEELPEKKDIVPEEKIEEEPPEIIEPEVPEPEVICQNECPQTGLKRCSNNGYQTCGNYDGDNCLEWSSIINCPANTICQNGECIQQKCADSTLYGQCSSIKPKFCQNGTLIDKCSVCSCPSDQQCQADESCISPTLSVSLSANPSSGDAPLNVELTAQVSGIDTGPANYIFYCNRSYTGTDVIPGYNHRIDYVFSSSYPDVCNYPSPGIYTAKVIVERGGLAAEDRVIINVATPQCTSGPCCDLTTQTFKPSTYKCQDNVNVEYSCPWGNEPGDDVGVRYQDRYCSGNSGECNGPLEWSDWAIHSDCKSNKACIEGACATLRCSDGTFYDQCSVNKPKYCQNRVLINKCSVCGCPSDQQCQADESCISAPIVQCTSGPCCDISTNIFRPSTYICQENVAAEYACPWGNEPGDDVGVRYQSRYCSGSSADCDGSLIRSDWNVYDDCTSNEACMDGTCTILTCSDGTPYNQCSANQPKYCDNGSLINKCSVCDCPSGQICQGDGSCKAILTCDHLIGSGSNIKFVIVPCSFNESEDYEFDGLANDIADGFAVTEPYKSNLDKFSIYQVNDFRGSGISEGHCWYNSLLFEAASICGNYDQVIAIAHNSGEAGGSPGNFSVVGSGIPSGCDPVTCRGSGCPFDPSYGCKWDYRIAYTALHETGHTIAAFRHTCYPAGGSTVNNADPSEDPINCGGIYEPAPPENEPCPWWNSSEYLNWVLSGDPNFGCYPGCDNKDNWYRPWYNAPNIMCVDDFIQYGFTPVERKKLYDKLRGL